MKKKKQTSKDLAKLRKSFGKRLTKTQKEIFLLLEEKVKNNTSAKAKNSTSAYETVELLIKLGSLAVGVAHLMHPS